MEVLYYFTIFPIELIYKGIYLFLADSIGNYGFALFLLSLINFFLCVPLRSVVANIQQRETILQSVLSPQIAKIKSESNGADKQRRIHHLYGRYGYHPILAIRSVAGLLVQLPFLIAAYYMLLRLEVIKNIPFLFIKDLSQPDALLFGINILPFIMTGINVAAAFTLKDYSKKTLRQSIGIAFFFLALLYAAPSALLLFWTMNNLIYLIVNFLPKKRRESVFLKKISHPIQSTLKKQGFVLSSVALFFSLVFFLPILFLILQNLHMFQLADVYETIGFVLAICILLACIGLVFDVLANSLSRFQLVMDSSYPFTLSVKNKESESGDKRSSLIISFGSFFYFIAIVLSFYAIVTYVVDLDLYFQNTLILILVGVGLVVIFFVIVQKCKFKIINVFLLSCLFIMAVQWPFALMDYKDIGFSSLALSEKEVNYKHSNIPIVEKAFSNFPFDEEIKNKPNIYLLFLESHHDFEIQKRVFGIDTAPMEKALTDSGFRIYNGVYSNAPATLPSLFTLYTMQPHFTELIRGLADVKPSVYGVYGGSLDNPLFSYLKQQGYQIASYLPSDFIKNKGPLLDYSSAIDKKISSIKDKETKSEYFLERVLGKITPKLYNVIWQTEESKTDEMYANLNVCYESNSPIFATIYINRLHIMHGIKSSNYTALIESDLYQRAIDAANSDILFYINDINEKDPNAVIILIGDHGYRYAIYTGVKGGGGLAGIKYSERYKLLSSTLAQDATLGMSPADVAKDTFGTLLAVKMPQDAIQDIKFEKNISHANLFKHIFAALNHNERYLNFLSENISSSLSGDVSVREGDIVYDNSFDLLKWKKEKREDIYRAAKIKNLKNMEAISQDISLGTTGIYLSEQEFSKIKLNNCSTGTMDSFRIKAIDKNPTLLLPDIKIGKTGKVVFASKMNSPVYTTAWLFYEIDGKKDVVKQEIVKGENVVYLQFKADPGQVVHWYFIPSVIPDEYVFHNL